MGWTVIRFWGKEITKNTEDCIKMIEETIFKPMLDTMDQTDNME